MGALVTRRVRTRQPQSLPQLDPRFAALADFAWVASVGTVVGPAVSLAGGAKNVGTAEGIGLSSGYGALGASVPSLGTTTWTEFGCVLTDGVNNIFTLSARDTGQSIAIGPSSVNPVMWGIADMTMTGAIPAGLVQYVVRRNGALHSVWINGKLYGTISNSATPNAVGSVTPAIGAQAGSGGNQGSSPLTSAQAVLSVVRMPAALPDDVCLSLSENSWQALKAPARRLWLAYSAPAGGTNINPTSATLVLAGYAPTVSRTANQSITPSAVTLAIAGYAPAVAQTAGQNVLPGADALALAGYAPQVQQSANQAVSPGVASLAFVGFAPSIAQSVVTNVAPQAVALTLTGQAPTVTRTANQSISPAAGALAISGYAPSVVRTAAQAVQPGAGGVILTGYAPIVSQARISPYPQVYAATIMSVSTAYASTQLVDAFDAASSLEASLALATIMAESRAYANAGLPSTDLYLTASFV